MANETLGQLLKGDGMTVAGLCGHLDLSLDRAKSSLSSLSDKGIIEGFVKGEPGEVIRLSEQGLKLTQTIFTESDDNVKSL